MNWKNLKKRFKAIENQLDVLSVVPIIVKFKGSDTINEIYEIKIREFKQALALLNCQDKLEEARKELLEMLAIVNNRQTMLKGYTLTKADE